MLHAGTPPSLLGVIGSRACTSRARRAVRLFRHRATPKGVWPSAGA